MHPSDDQRARPNPGGDDRCYCKDPICPKMHSLSGPVILRLDHDVAWHALAAVSAMIGDLQDKDGFDRSLSMLKMAEQAYERALFSRSEREVAEDHRALLDEMARAAW